ncbi:MAG TPA: hypothetical protein VFH56_05325, partial [Acidimicrobiales bacterium]|nr:hypothetical protein [Acidimicrobiales bacterium]
ASYAQSLGEIQRLNNPATFWSQVSEAMDQPAMKIKKDVAEIGADFIKLGTAIAPTVAAIASGVADISTAFGSLPSFVKDSIGVVVTALAVGGPVGLAISGIGKLLDALGIEAAAGAGEAAPAISTIGAAADRSAVQLRVLAYTERAVGPAAAEGAATADTSLSLVGASALGAESKVATLRSTLLGLAGRIFTVSIVADILYHYRNQLAHGAANLAGHLGANSSHGGQPGPLDFLKHPIRSFFYSPAVHDTSSSGDNTRSYHDQQTQGDAGHTSYVRDYEREQHRKRFVRQHGGSPLYQLPAVPQKIQLDIAKAQAGYGSVAKAMDEERHWLLELIKSGRLKGQALTQAYQALASIQTKAVTDAHKATAQFDATVHNDTLLARARNDLAQGEVSVAQHLLALDEQRLQAMLSEAKTAEERKTVLNQLAEVNRLRHSKSSAFALSPRLQEEIAKADAIAALHPSSYGPDSDQIRLARQAKAAALKAIHSHTLTLQGLTQAWQ